MGRPRRKKEEQQREGPLQPHNNYYTSNYGDNSIALSPNRNEVHTAFAQEMQPTHIYVSTDVSMDTSTSSPSTSTTYTNATSYDNDPPSSATASDKPCVYGDPAMLVPNIRYDDVLLPLDILLPKATVP
ncbi:MAG: hypothetical protein M1840_008951 [Geoglossum simile]|nr:MAG: hypothetical protein M1840_008951 [Geoglossum simile]